MRDSAPPVRSEYPEDVHLLEIDGREFVLIGTAHVSRESADLVREVIEKERPDCVCIELDPQRYEALSQQRRFESLDLRQVIREKRLAALLANLVLASYQRKLGGMLGVMPGAELLEAAKTADEHGIPIALCDRDVRVTLRRAWASMSFFQKLKLLATLMASVFERPELSEEQLRELRKQDVVSELMQELGTAMPALKTVLIDERDAYLADRMRRAHGERVVAVVGAGHVPGICRALAEPAGADVTAYDLVPPVSTAWRWLGWGIPALIVSSLVAIGLTKGAAAAGENLVYWIVANGVPTTLGAALALAHPATIAAAFFVAPVTSLTPVIGAGYVLAFLQAWLRPPVVRELQSVADDVGAPRRWWSNRLLRILLVFVLTTLGSLVGTWLGGVEIVSNLF